MRGSLVVIAALCVIAAAAEASSVRFISADEGQDGKGKADRSEASEGTDPVLKKKMEDVVKKINDGEDQLEKVVESLDVDRSSEGDEGAGEGLKKAASSEKSKVQKRDVRRVLKQLAKRGMKRADEEDEDQQKILNGKKIILKYLNLQKIIFRKITNNVIYALSRLVKDPTERDAVVAALKTFEDDVEKAHNKMINSLAAQFGEFWKSSRKAMRADDIPALMNSLNQRNPMAIIPILLRLINGISGAASIADMAASFGGTRSAVSDVASLLDLIQATVGVLPELLDYS